MRGKIVEYMEKYDHEQLIFCHGNVKRVISIAKRDGIPTYRAADVMVEERLRNIRAIKRIGKQG
jgi:hypothetical protein